MSRIFLTSASIVLLKLVSRIHPSSLTTILYDMAPFHFYGCRMIHLFFVDPARFY
jgi:hypothetical protein